VPEGDTIHRAAATLDKVLAGKPLVRFDAPTIAFRPFAPETVVEGAEAQGKHCLIHFDDGRTLRTHMRMNGSWHVYRSGERWRKPRGALRALVAVPDWEAVCFSAPVVELTSARGASLAVAHLGPDLVEPDADLDGGRGPSLVPGWFDRRRLARPAGRRGHRQHLAQRGVLRLRCAPRHRGRRHRAGDASPAARGGGPAAAGEHGRHPAGGDGLRQGR
jgi:hypothetical protein